jgi:hypothetical protein
MHDVEGHDVEHLVADHEAADLLGQRVDPLEAADVVREALGEELALALAQVGAHFEQEVALRRLAERFQFRVEVGREQSRPGTELEDVAANDVHHLHRLQREAAREHRRDLGRGDEVARRSRLARAEE